MSGTSRDNRPRKLSDVGFVDFAARRQRIQQAFTKTVQENEKKEEVEAEKRRNFNAALGETHQAGDERRGPEQFISQEQAIPNVPDTNDFQSGEAFGGSHHELHSEEQPKSEGDLTINVIHLSERSVLDLAQEDSPTLGMSTPFPVVNYDEERNEFPLMDREPMSAVTAGTADTADTFFDNEPQDEVHSSQEPRTLLSHIMNMRSPSPASPEIARRMAPTLESPDRDDKESIHIMLRDTPVDEKPDSIETQGDDISGNLSNDGFSNRWSTNSWTSSIRSKDRQSTDRERDTPMERIDEHSPPLPEVSGHHSFSTTASHNTPQPWSPALNSTPPTARSTLDHDSYSSISRVLDHYHDPAESVPEFQQRISTQSSDLAREGGYDSKKVTQLYLQKLAKTKHAQNGTTSKSSNSQTTGSYSDQTLPHLTYARQSTPAHNDYQERSQELSDEDGKLLVTSREDPSSVENLEVDPGHLNPQRASLNHPDDWASTSPSILDWIPAQAADTPTEEKSDPRSATWMSRESELNGDSEIDPPLSRVQSIIRSKLPELKDIGTGLGIEAIGISVTSPQDDSSPMAPPKPSHEPPPIPTPTSMPQLVQSQTPSRNSKLSKHSHDSTFNASDTPPGPTTRSRESSIHKKERKPLSTDASQPIPERPTPPPEPAIKDSSTAPEQKRLTRRKNIIKELVDTEHSFGQDMKVVDDIYKGTSNVAIISPEDVKTLFGNSDQIVAFSSDFLDALKQAARSIYILPKSRRWRSKRASVATSNSGTTDDQSSAGGGEANDDDKDRKTFIGEAFVQHLVNMETVYADYLKNHDAANQKLQALQSNPKVQIWLKECRAYAHDLTSAWDLDSLLVKPVQRILKYPLLLKELLEVTPENHPDYNSLDIAAREMVGVSVRINEMKRRADLMEQVVSSRKRKESEGRRGLPKAFGRRTEKLKQQVGLSDMVEDKEYNQVSEKFGSHFFQLQVVMRDVEMYTSEVQSFTNHFNDFIIAIEGYMDVGQTSHPEIESKWRKFRQTMREISMTALSDHVSWCFK